MAVSVRKITLWRSEVPNRPGMLAGALAALSQAGADLKVVMAYRFPGDESRGAVELYPVTGKRAQTAARRAGLSESGIPTLLVDGDDRPGVGAAIARALAEEGINLAFFVAQALGRRYAAVIGFDSESDAKKAVPLIKKAKPSKK
jgi:hypothetical protein